MTGPVNTYLSFKRVSRFPNDAHVISAGQSSAGVTFVAALAEGDHPAFLLKIFPERGPDAVLLRLDFVRLLDSVIGAEAAEVDAWEPLRQDQAQPHLWGNSWLTCGVVEIKPGIKHISYHRRDRAPIRDWRVGQRVKNELAGPEWEAMELYPAESRVVDTSNEYHLYAFDGELPVGFSNGERATQAQLDEHVVGYGEGPVQTDDPDADTSGFTGIDPDNFYTHQRVPDDSLAIPKGAPVITPLWVAKCPNLTCEWEGDPELSEEEAEAAYDYHLKWVVHDDDVTV
jgi:hypothetical protein